MHGFNYFGAFSMAADVEIKSYALRTIIINGLSVLYGMHLTQTFSIFKHRDENGVLFIIRDQIIFNFTK